MKIYIIVGDFIKFWGTKCNAQLGEIVPQGAFFIQLFFQAIFQFLSNLGMQGIFQKVNNLCNRSKVIIK